MRTVLAAAVLAASVLALPAAAQPRDEAEAESLVQRVLNRLQQNLAGARDYSFTLVWAGVRVPVWVHREEDEWEVEVPDSPPVGQLMSLAVMWPIFSSLDLDPEPEDEEWEFRLDRDTVAGRPARVITAWRAGGGIPEELPDSLRLHVDEASSQIARVFFLGRMDPEDLEDIGGTERAEATLELSDYRTVEGLTLPHALHLSLRMELDLDPEQRQSMEEELAEAREVLREAGTSEALEMLQMMETVGALMAGEPMVMPMRVENVRVNAGRPAEFEPLDPRES